MDVIKSDLKEGYMVLKITDNDDLWVLKNILEEGDRVKARTLRSQFVDRGEQKIKVGKIPVFLEIRIEKIEYKEFGFKLRLAGKILEAPEDIQLGSYHTIDVDIGTILTIFKNEWKKYQLEKIKKSQKEVPEILLVVCDTSEATFASLGKSGLKIISEINNPHSLQYEEDKLSGFYRNVAKEIGKLCKNKVILAGPGFAKEHVYEEIKSNFPEIKDNIYLESTSSATKAGINEIIKKGSLEKVLQDSEISEETKIIDELFFHIRKEDGFSVYGINEVKRADDVGAIEILIVSEKRIKEKTIEELASSVESKGGKVKIISVEHEAGEQFERIGGIAAILRFKLAE